MPIHAPKAMGDNKPQTAPSLRRSPLPFNTPVPRLIPLTTPNNNRIHSAGGHNTLSGQTDRQTDRQTDTDRQIG